MTRVAVGFALLVGGVNGLTYVEHWPQVGGLVCLALFAMLTCGPAAPRNRGEH
ncbi:MAG: hypothetical protein LC640_09465 [Frankia sp.]|nr:hypothetical protein [Frankia sp.]